MKKTLLLAAALASYNAAYASAGPVTNGILDFAAPVVYDKSNFTNTSAVGTMVFDTLDGSFYGKDATNNWQHFSTVATANETVYLKEIRSSGTNGGGCTSGSFQTRSLTTIENPNGATWISLSSNRFTLGAGTYEIEAHAPAYHVDNNVAKIQNITDGSEAILGQISYATSAGAAAGSNALVVGYVTIASAKDFELQHRCSTTQATNGFGQANGYASVNEVFSIVKITKIQ